MRAHGDTATFIAGGKARGTVLDRKKFWLGSRTGLNVVAKTKMTACSGNLTSLF